jgi:hypothetical protein
LSIPVAIGDVTPAQWMQSPVSTGDVRPRYGWIAVATDVGVSA